MTSIQVNDIVKTYRNGKTSITALDRLTFTVEKGELFGLIGPDGAGKTSLIRIMTTLLLPDKGSVMLEDLDVVKDYKAIRNRVGYLPGRFSLYQDLTVEENLRFFATIFNTTVNAHYDLVRSIYDQIKPFKNRKAGKLSGGMKQKLALCCALIHRPSMLFLDEPTTGVDSVSRKEFWEMLAELKKKEITIIVSTPYMDEASQCDRIALIQEGRILGIDTPEGVIAKYTRPLWAARSDDMFGLLRDLRSFESVERCYPFGEYHHFIVRNEHMRQEELTGYIAGKGHNHIDVHKAAPNIEDCFLDLMATPQQPTA